MCLSFLLLSMDASTKDIERLYGFVSLDPSSKFNTCMNEHLATNLSLYIYIYIYITHAFCPSSCGLHRDLVYDERKRPRDEAANGQPWIAARFCRRHEHIPPAHR